MVATGMSTAAVRCGATAERELDRAGPSAVATIMTAIGMLVLATVAQAATLQGGLCPMAHVRVNGAAGTLMREELWEHNKDEGPLHPVFGWVDFACWNTGGVAPIDIAKRAWFAVAGSEGAQPRIQFADPQTVSSQSGVGVTTEGPALMGTVFPGHDCVFAVQLWSETCLPK